MRVLIGKFTAQRVRRSARSWYVGVLGKKSDSKPRSSTALASSSGRIAKSVANITTPYFIGLPPNSSVQGSVGMGCHDLHSQPLGPSAQAPIESVGPAIIANGNRSDVRRFKPT